MSTHEHGTHEHGTHEHGTHEHSVTVLLQGGSRHGDTTTVDGHVTRLLTPSEAPGLVDVYTRTESETELRGNPGTAVVFEFTGQEAASSLDPGLLHLPQD